MKFDDLSINEKSNIIFDKCCCYPKNWNKGENCIEKENAFYIKAKINNNLLSYISESNTFPREELLNQNPHFLYGKYKNRWKFLNEDGQIICETSKFEGHNSFDCSGLVFAAYRSAGLDWTQWDRVNSRIYYSWTKRVPLSELVPGDLVFYSYKANISTIHHISIYAGNGMMWEAHNTKKGLLFSSIYSIQGLIPFGGRV